MHATDKTPLQPFPIELAVVMPVYNEEASVRKVVKEWFEEVSNWTENFVFIAVDDGSTDLTPQRLCRLKEELGERFISVRQENQGHGQSCLNGYRHAIELGCQWVLQIDSDGQCDTQYFHRLWRTREHCDVVYGVRVKRDDGFRRLAVSMFLRIALFLQCRTVCLDANVPYRLMRSSVIDEHCKIIPKSFNLANIALAVILRADPRLRPGHVPIHFRERYGGEPKVKMSQFSVKGMELLDQLKQMAAASSASSGKA